MRAHCLLLLLATLLAYACNKENAGGGPQPDPIDCLKVSHTILDVAVGDLAMKPPFSKIEPVVTAWEAACKTSAWPRDFLRCANDSHSAEELKQCAMPPALKGEIDALAATWRPVIEAQVAHCNAATTAMLKVSMRAAAASMRPPVSSDDITADMKAIFERSRTAMETRCVTTAWPEALTACLAKMNDAKDMQRCAETLAGSVDEGSVTDDIASVTAQLNSDLRAFAETGKPPTAAELPVEGLYKMK